jgi:hypothetical protein
MSEEYLRTILKFAEIDGNYGPIEIFLSDSDIETELIQMNLLPPAMRGYAELAEAVLLCGISMCRLTGGSRSGTEGVCDV